MAKSGIRVNYAASYWTPPLTPKLAFDLESRQIENLGVAPMVSLTDHDSITAPMLLRTVPSARQIPVSLEWTVPYATQSFHLGVHNLPSTKADQWMQILAGYTANPSTSSNARLKEILCALHDEPNVLVIFNHPLWDLYFVGQEKHEVLVNEFLQKNGAYLHALELNGLRNWEENRAVRRLADQWNIVTISGGDRHGVEPNANINLTHATCFTEFVHEIRREKRSNVLFMPQYARPEAPHSAVDPRRNPPLSGFSAGIAQMGRARLSSRCQRSNTPAQRVVAERVCPTSYKRRVRNGSADGLCAIFRRSAHCLERVARIADGP
jgi:hypothetical protein